MAAAPPLQRLPWYSFLYRLLGAQGTFWLWLLAPLALWWTFEPAMIRLANRKPRPLEIQALASEPLARWALLSGVRIGVDRRLLLRDAEPGLSPVQLLVDPSDPAATWWVDTHALALTAKGFDPSGKPLTGPSEKAGEARRLLIRRFAKLRGDRSLYLPAPERSVLLLDAELSLSAGDPVSSPRQDAVASFESETDDQIARVLERIDPAARVQGVVGRTPGVLARRFRTELDLAAPTFVLDVGRRPRELESIVFSVALIVLLFLGVGLYGAKGIPTKDSEPSN